MGACHAIGRQHSLADSKRPMKARPFLARCRHALVVAAVFSQKMLAQASPTPTFQVHTVVMPSNAFAMSVLVETTGHVVVVDAGLSATDAAAIRARVDRTSKPIAAILVTHAHIDHYGGAFILAADTIPLVTGSGVARHLAEYDATNYARFGRTVPAGSRTFDRILGHGDTLSIDGVTFRLGDLGPGESFADVWWLVEAGNRSAAVIGDVAMFGLPPLLQSGHSTAWLRSLEQLKQRIPAGTPIYIGHDIRAIGLDEHSWDHAILDWQAARLRTFRASVERVTGGERLLTPDEVARVVADMNADAPENSRNFDFLISTSANVLAAELIAERQKREFERLIQALFVRPRSR